ncbi:MAG: GpE family phage tail protein [Pseudomonadota bacterium]
MAAIFHWSLSEFETMSVVDIFAWHRRATDRYKRMNEVKRR